MKVFFITLGKGGILTPNPPPHPENLSFHFIKSDQIKCSAGPGF